MREPLDLERPREQVCPICHDKGWYRAAGSGEIRPCDSGCSAGRGVIATQEVRRRLSAIWTDRDVDLFLQSRNAAFRGERPVNLLREGREDEVLEAIERIPGLPPAAAPVALPDRRGTPPRPEAIPPDPEAVLRVLIAKARQAGETRIAKALEQHDLSRLTEREHAYADALLTGDGYLVNGKRVDPADVVVLRWPS